MSLERSDSYNSSESEEKHSGVKSRNNVVSPKMGNTTASVTEKQNAYHKPAILR